MGNSPVNVVGLELMWAGKLADAVRWLRFAVETYPEEADSHMCLAGAYLASGDRQNARRWYEQAHKISPNGTAKARLAELDAGSND